MLTHGVQGTIRRDATGISGGHGHSHSHGQGHGHSVPASAAAPPAGVNSPSELNDLPLAPTQAITAVVLAETELSTDPLADGAATPAAAHVPPVPMEQMPTRGALNMRGVFLHVAGDALGSVVVIISALVNMYTTWEGAIYVDPLLR